jgi:hypothetical protein
LFVFCNFGKSLKDDLWHIFIVRKNQDLEGSFNEKEGFADIAAGNRFGVDVDCLFERGSWH